MTSRKPHPNERLAATAARMAALAARYTHAQEMCRQVRAMADTRQTAGERVAGGSVTSTTEAQALRALGAFEWTADLHTHLDDWCHTSDLFAARMDDAIGWAHRQMGTTPEPLAVVVQCRDGSKAKGYEGIALPWVPQWHDERNGWHDPHCRDIAGPSGLCERCKRRMDRWRAARNLPTVGIAPGVHEVAS